MRRGDPQRAGELFAAGGAGSARVSSFGAAAPASMLVHALALSLLLLAPLWTTPTPPRVERDYLGVLLYDPPPPPPPPQSFGREQVQRRATSQVQPQRPTPSITTVEHATTLEPTATIEPEPALESAGSPTSSAPGLADGMDLGEPGGEVGGVPGGVRDGIVGGTGHLLVPVTHVDHAPRLLRMVPPEYPPEAFTKKIEGVVSVEILVDAGGRVARTQITQSVPLLDAAAVAAVRQWVFSPAIKDGRPVATLATAPVTFKIY
jgi:periplasmic protein TonB